MKNLMTIDRLNAETALELPNREMLLVTVVITNVDLLSNNTVTIPIKNNNVAVQVCAAVDLLSDIGWTNLDCDIRQQ